MEKLLSDVGCLVKTLVCHLVDHPEGVRLDELRGTQTVVLELTVAPQDVGQIIGRSGRVVNAIRELLLNIGARTDRRYLLNVLGHGPLTRLVPTPLVSPPAQRQERTLEVDAAPGSVPLFPTVVTRRAQAHRINDEPASYPAALSA